MKAIEALFETHKIAFAPFVFETAYCMLEFGILESIDKSKSEGITVQEIAKETGVSEYGVRVLAEMAYEAGILNQLEEDKYANTKIGYFLLNDEMTKVNLYFTHDVCYKGLYNLKESIEEGRPAGLKELGPWNTIYEGLSILPGRAKKSWFEFDHYYSDNSFDFALPIIFKHHPKRIFDIGGNTGKWALATTKYDKDVRVTMLDLPIQINAAKENIANHPESVDRVDYHEINLLDNSMEIPAGADVYWMSQFLDCFSEQEIEDILNKIKKNMKKDATIFIMETFIDDQRFPAASYSLVATSLYFTVMANGNSKMYSKSAFKYIIDKAGMEILDEHHLHGTSFHTILEVRLK